MTGNSLDTRSYRLKSLDALRGLAVIFMALDHSRDFFLIDSKSDPGADTDVSIAVFLTRWVTHFCAPTFVLLAGASAGLMQKRRAASQLSWLLLSRGVWLIAVDCVFISTALTFSPLGYDSPLGNKALTGSIVVILQVLWVIGVGMVTLAAACRLGRMKCLGIGLFIVCFHNLLDLRWPESAIYELHWPVWVALHSQMSLELGPFVVLFLYPVLPWIGVILCGFGISSLFEQSELSQRRTLYRAGLCMLVLFMLLRYASFYGDPNPWQSQADQPVQSFKDFFEPEKYPPSLLFLLMTVGTASVVCAYACRLPQLILDRLVVLGRVPFAFYVGHFYLLHALALVLGLIQDQSLSDMTRHFEDFLPEFGLSLAGVYAVWILVLVIMYPFCVWIARIKSENDAWWLSYV